MISARRSGGTRVCGPSASNADSARSRTPARSIDKQLGDLVVAAPLLEHELENGALIACKTV